jgi:hypothetical protein
MPDMITEAAAVALAADTAMQNDAVHAGASIAGAAAVAQNDAKVIARTARLGCRWVAAGAVIALILAGVACVVL